MSNSLKVYSLSSLSKMKGNSHYTEAKRGNFSEARKLVEELLCGKECSFSFLHNDEILLPVIAEEAGGKNKIPFALAIWISEKFGNEIELNILQSVRANHTGSNAINRLRKVDFKNLNDSSKSLKGKKFVIIDDHVTMGGTIAGLAKFINDNVGIVEKVISFSNTLRQIKADDGSFNISTNEDEINEVRKRFGSYIEDLAGMKYEEMSKPIIHYLLKFKNLENFQKKHKSITSSVSTSFFLKQNEMESIWKEFSEDYLSNCVFSNNKKSKEGI